MRYNYISIHSIFGKLIRDTSSEFNEDDTIEWVGEALEFIGAVQGYEEAIAFIEIKNHQGKLSQGLHKIIQVARNNNYSGYKECTPLKVCEEANDVCNITLEENPCSCLPSDAVWLDCKGSPIVGYDLAYYRPYFDLRAEYNGWSNTRFYKENFSPVRLANHKLFGTLVDRDNGIGYTGSTDEYTVVAGNTIRTSFKEGQLCIPYLRQPRDLETGYPMIPDHISYKTAITKYVTMKIFEREFYSGRDGAANKFQKAEEDWQWYCRQAGNDAKMISGIDEYQNLLDQRTTLIPNHNKYYGFFGNLSKPEIGYPTMQRGGGERPNNYLNYKPDDVNCQLPNTKAASTYKKTPPIVTVRGSSLISVIIGEKTTYKWIDYRFKGFKVEVFANVFNRYLTPSEYKLLPDGGVEILVGGPYTEDDIFKMIPNGCYTVLPIPPVVIPPIVIPPVLGTCQIITIGQIFSTGFEFGFPTDPIDDNYYFEIFEDANAAIPHGQPEIIQPDPTVNPQVIGWERYGLQPNTQYWFRLSPMRNGIVTKYCQLLTITTIEDTPTPSNDITLLVDNLVLIDELNLKDSND